MKKIIFITFLIGVSAAFAFAQPPRVPAKITPRNVPFKLVTEISNADWATLAAALKREDWKQSADLAAQHLQTLKTENEKKQLAQLRYIELFSLAGQILAANAQGSAAEAERVWTEVDRVLETFINKEFLMPPRPFATDCEKKLNVICQVKDTPNTLRTTATNQEGTGIHSFDYVQFDEAVNIKEFDGKETFVGGILRRAEYNEDKTKPWVLRLFFNKGFARIVIETFSSASGQNTKLFEEEYVGGDRPPEIEIFNDSDRTLYLDLGQNKTTPFEIPARASKKLTLPEGIYKYKATATKVLPLEGQYNFKKGFVYTWRFIIVTKLIN